MYGSQLCIMHYAYSTHAWLPYIFLLFSGFSNVCHFTCVWPSSESFYVTYVDTLFPVMGFISLIDEIQFMLISSCHICIRSIHVYETGQLCHSPIILQRKWLSSWGSFLRQTKDRATILTLCLRKSSPLYPRASPRWSFCQSMPCSSANADARLSKIAFLSAGLLSGKRVVWNILP